MIVDLPVCFRLTSYDEFRSLIEGSRFNVEAVFGDYRRGPYVAGESCSMVWVLTRS